ncbi:CBS domain-containing protein [Desulfobacteraceae bacterium SEEP-SAG9]|nr:CBS domain-containing protein [Desulfobacteraceae bacterium SEEP-SAG9]
MFISKSMTAKVITIDKEADIFEARDKMEKNRIRHLPVVEADDRLIGIVSDRDIRSAWPYDFSLDFDRDEEKKRLSELKIKDIMTKDPVTVSLSYTLEDAVLLIQQKRVGAFPVVDDQGRLKGIVSIRDLLRAFINVLGIEEPGTLLCILVEEKIGQMKKIVDVITEEKISFGSILVTRYWDKGKRAVFPYLLTQNVVKVKSKLEKMGYTLLDPMEWYIDQLPKHE